MMTFLLVLVLILSIRLSWWTFKGLAKITWFFLCLGGYLVLGVLAVGLLSIAFAGPLIAIALLISFGRLIFAK